MAQNLPTYKALQDVLVLTLGILQHQNSWDLSFA